MYIGVYNRLTLPTDFHSQQQMELYFWSVFCSLYIIRDLSLQYQFRLVNLSILRNPKAL